MGNFFKNSTDQMSQANADLAKLAVLDEGSILASLLARFKADAIYVRLPFPQLCMCRL